MEKLALQIVELAVSRNTTLAQRWTSRDLAGLRALTIACTNAYFSAANQDEAFSAGEAKGIVEYAIVLMESTSKSEQAVVLRSMVRNLSGAIETNIDYFRRKYESTKCSHYLTRIEVEKNLLNSLKGIG